MLPFINTSHEWAMLVAAIVMFLIVFVFTLIQLKVLRKMGILTKENEMGERSFRILIYTLVIIITLVGIIPLFDVPLFIQIRN